MVAVKVIIMNRKLAVVVSACVALGLSELKAAQVRVVRADEIASVSNRTGTVQERLIDVNAAIYAARRGAPKGTRILVVGKNGSLLDDRAFNEALKHFEGGNIATAMPENALERLNELSALPERPSTVVPDGKKWKRESWKKRCADKQREIAANDTRVFDVVFFGDSITHNWERDDAWGIYAQYGGFGKPVWTEAFKGLKVLNIGIGGDRTQDLLWRGLNGDLDNYTAKLFVVMIGTNNVRTNTPEEIADGVKAVVDLVKAKHPESKIVLYAIFPRGEKADDRLRAKNEQANAIIRNLADGETVLWHDINAKLLTSDGTLTREKVFQNVAVNVTGEATLKSRGLIVMDETDCVVDVARFYLDFTVDESCGKCAPCRIGGRKLLNYLNKISEGRGVEDDIKQLEAISDSMCKASLCGLGQTAANPVKSTLKYFMDEYLEHINEKKCRSGKCSKLVQYKIDAEKCKGCTLCARKCPANAIVGELKKPHVIDTQKCIKCGACEAACKFGAISHG